MSKPVDAPLAEAPGEIGDRPNWLVRYISRFDDGEVLRWAFRGLLLGTIGVLGMDLYEMEMAQDEAEVVLPSDTSGSPLLPPAFTPDQPSPIDPRPFLTGEDATLRQPMRFTLGADGVLSAEGAIDAGSTSRLSAELDARGEYVKIVSLNSPGGSVDDAMAMARLIRDRKLNTEVKDGSLCASSCPLLFSGGIKRLAGEKAAIGVHQFYAVENRDADNRPTPASAISDAQRVTARINRHLSDMGVDPAAWLHALDTPPQSLYYFSGKELSGYKLTTGKA